MNLVTGTPGLRGFDANAVVSYEAAQAMDANGYRFAVRYVRRHQSSASDLTPGEVANLFLAGLAVMPVQHVESESSWEPTDQKGRDYGQAAVDAVRECGLPLGVTVWLDLEGVATTVEAEQVIRYCNYWHDRVTQAGFQPGLYVGWRCGLTPDQLYRRLKFTRYWGAYNLNTDEYPAVCGIGMKQKEAKPRDIPPGIGFAIDVDAMLGDALGRFPMLAAPNGWPG